MGNLMFNPVKQVFARDKGHQQQLSSDLLAQESQDEKQGGATLEFLTVFLGKILPCSEVLLRRLIWVLIWSWKAAPVVLYEAFLLDLPCLNKNNKESDSGDNGLGGSCNCVFLNTWWQKAIAIPAAMGFYYFLYDYVSQPLLEAMECCSSEILYQGLAIGLLVLHFVSGVAMHMYQQRKKECDSQTEETQQQQKQTQQSSELEMGNSNAPASERDWIRLDDRDLPETGISTTNLPPITASSAPALSEHATDPVKKKKKGFWPFRKKEKRQVLENSKTVGAAIV